METCTSSSFITTTRDYLYQNLSCLSSSLSLSLCLSLKNRRYMYLSRASLENVPRVPLEGKESMRWSTDRLKLDISLRREWNLNYSVQIALNFGSFSFDYSYSQFYYQFYYSSSSQFYSSSFYYYSYSSSSSSSSSSSYSSSSSSSLSSSSSSDIQILLKSKPQECSTINIHPFGGILLISKMPPSPRLDRPHSVSSSFIFPTQTTKVPLNALITSRRKHHKMEVKKQTKRGQKSMSKQAKTVRKPLNGTPAKENVKECATLRGKTWQDRTKSAKRAPVRKQFLEKLAEETTRHLLRGSTPKVKQEFSSVYPSVLQENISAMAVNVEDSMKSNCTAVTSNALLLEEKINVLERINDERMYKIKEQSALLESESQRQQQLRALLKAEEQTNQTLKKSVEEFALARSRLESDLQEKAHVLEQMRWVHQEQTTSLQQEIAYLKSTKFSLERRVKFSEEQKERVKLQSAQVLQMIREEYSEAFSQL